MYDGEIIERERHNDGFVMDTFLKSDVLKEIVRIIDLNRITNYALINLCANLSSNIYMIYLNLACKSITVGGLA